MRVLQINLNDTSVTTSDNLGICKTLAEARSRNASIDAHRPNM